MASPTAAARVSQLPGQAVWQQLGFTTLDQADWVRASDAGHVRDDDLVFGFLVGIDAYCVPFFVIDYYHTVNTELAGIPIVLVSCDRCASAGAWSARAPDGRRLSFQNWGIAEAQLLWRDRETQTVWSHSLARGISGELAGAALEPVGAILHMTFGDWRTRNGDTFVLAEVGDPLHRDLRHGHGRNEVFERPGIGAHDHEHFFATMSRAWDERLPEQEMVLGVSAATVSTAYPWRALKHEGNVVNASIDALPIVVWCDPAPDGCACAAFERRIDDTVTEFAVRDGSFVDLQTRSRWTLEGRCTAGALSGYRLQPVRSVFERWFSWSAGHPDTAIFATARTPAASSRWGVDPGPLAPIVEALRTLPNHVLLREQVVRGAHPQGCRWGVVLLIDGHPFRCWKTAGARYARDLCAWPREHGVQLATLRSGPFVLEDGCQELWTDWTHTTPRASSDVPWSPLLSDDRVRDAFAAGCAAAEPEVGARDAALIDVVDALDRLGHTIDSATRRLLPPSALAPGCESAAEIRFGDDRMILYRYGDADGARDAAARFGHCLRGEIFVLRSTPLNMYRLRAMEMAMRPPARIAWSDRLEDKTFGRAFDEAVHDAFRH